MINTEMIIYTYFFSTNPKKVKWIDNKIKTRTALVKTRILPFYKLSICFPSSKKHVRNTISTTPFGGKPP